MREVITRCRVLLKGLARIFSGGADLGLAGQHFYELVRPAGLDILHERLKIEATEKRPVRPARKTY